MKTIVKIIPFQHWTLACLFCLALPATVWAHAFLDRSDPQVGSSLTNAPSEVKVWFTQELEPAFSSIVVQDAQGQEVDKKDRHLDAKNKSLLEISLPPLPAGTYTVIWHVVSVDTHRTQGRFKFTIK